MCQGMRAQKKMIPQLMSRLSNRQFRKKLCGGGGKKGGKVKQKKNKARVQHGDGEVDEDEKKTLRSKAETRQKTVDVRGREK